MLGIGGLGVLGLFVLVRMIIDFTESKAKKIRKEERRAVRGAKAEEQIGNILESLSEDFLVIHDIDSPYGNIDHIVISKHNGVFLIETKAHGGRVSAVTERLLVNGHEPEKDFIAQALKNTYWLRDKIRSATKVEIRIAPIVVFTNAFVEQTAPIKGVNILNAKYLLNVLHRPNVKTQNMAVWELREKILEALFVQSGCQPR